MTKDEFAPLRTHDELPHLKSLCGVCIDCGGVWPCETRIALNEIERLSHLHGLAHSLAGVRGDEINKLHKAINILDDENRALREKAKVLIHRVAWREGDAVRAIRELGTPDASGGEEG